MRARRTTWLLLLAVTLGAVLPAVCVIWFMTEAARNQTDAARQRLSDALQGQLRLLRERIDADWRARVVRLQNSGGSGAREFHRLVTVGGLDAVVLPPRDGAAGYPAPLRTGTSAAVAASADWRIAQALETSDNYAAAAAQYAALAARERAVDQAARAAQAHVRVLLRTGNDRAALQAIEHYVSTPRLVSGRDRHGRLIIADVELLALRLLSPGEAAFQPAAERLAVLVNDYERTVMPSSQRLFVMGELDRLAGAQVNLPTHAAERLAMQFLERDGPPSSETLEPSRLPDVWKLRIAHGGTALFRTQTIAGMADTVLRDQSVATGATFALLAPGRTAGAESIPASAVLPGWILSVSLDGAGRTDLAAQRRVTTYLWAGTLAVAGLAIGGLLIWQAFHRQLRVSRLKTDLVAAVSHELRTPLASMRALVDLMLENPSIDRERTREYLSLIAGENARLSRLIEHFLTFSRIERNGHGLVFRHVSPAAMLHEAATVQGRERFPGLTIDVAPNLEPLYGDEDALVTVLVNLLENAYKYTGDDKRVVLTARQEGARLVLEVQDNGIGIARRDRKRIFQPFFQVDQRLARERGGCGLGLSIVDFIVRAHGGDVTVDSEPGTGSVFRVKLPARTAGTAAA